jgi:hypothetical protein
MMWIQSAATAPGGAAHAPEPIAGPRCFPLGRNYTTGLGCVRRGMWDQGRLGPPADARRAASTNDSGSQDSGGLAAFQASLPIPPYHRGTTHRMEASRVAPLLALSPFGASAMPRSGPDLIKTTLIARRHSPGVDVAGVPL